MMCVTFRRIYHPCGLVRRIYNLKSCYFLEKPLTFCQHANALKCGPHMTVQVFWLLLTVDTFL